MLLIDGDMQLNLSLSLFDEDQVLAFAQSEKNLYEGLKRQDDLSGYIVHSEYEGLDLIPSSTLMSSIEYELFTKWQREFILRKCLTQIKESGAYDYILIDAPPTLGGWVMNILCASDEIIIPVESTPWGLFGLGNMFEFLEEVRQITPDLKLGGIVITKVDTRKSYFKQTLETLKSLEDVPVFDTYIRVDSGIEWIRPKCALDGRQASMEIELKTTKGKTASYADARAEICLLDGHQMIAKEEVQS